MAINPMTIRIVTDSTSDISPEVAEALGITVVPSYVHFGEALYRDGVDIGKEGFYQKLSSKISDTVKSAHKGKGMVKGKHQIEIIDSRLVSVGLSLAVVAAARSANSGENLRDVLDETRSALNQIRMLIILDTMKYLVAGGRISKATAAVSSIFQIKPLLTLENGEVVRAGLVRSYSSGINRLYEFVAGNPAIQDLAVAYSTVPEDAEELKNRLADIFPEERINIVQIGATLGVHGGPGVLMVGLRQTRYQVS
jgi:DegV family protein with EDD domain